MSLIPAPFIDRMRELHGKEGELWTAALPELIDRCLSRFGLTAQAPYADLTWNYLLRAKRPDGSAVVLKCSYLKEELTREIAVLRAYAGRGAVAVLDAEEDWGVVILEQADPGAQLAEIEDDTLATGIFCSVFRRLHGMADRSAESGAAASETDRTMESTPVRELRVPSLKEHFAAIERYRERYSEGDEQPPLPENWVENAEECLAYLIATTERPVLLHGDLHHYNILRQGAEEWAVIDPKGILGDIHFDAIQYMLNYDDRGGTPEQVLQRRIAIMSERLGLEPRRIGMWGVARGVLEACWSIESGDDWQGGIAISERFAKWID